MSRILVFDLENKVSAEVHGFCNRGWAINEGGKAEITLSEKEALSPHLQIGRMVYVDGTGQGLPNWAGMIDTPWSAISPIKISAYDPNSLLAMRQPWSADSRKDDNASLAVRFIDLANQLGDLYLREGNIDHGSGTSHREINNSQSNWSQLSDLLKDTDLELQFRPEMDKDRRLIIYVDIKQSLGTDCNAVLQDGSSPNMQVLDATVDGDIINSALATNKASTATNKIKTNIFYDDESAKKYRERNQVLQFDTQSKSDLENFVKNYLVENSSPYLKLKVGVLTGHFDSLRLGNTLKVRATKIVLPGGRRGWSGEMRINAMNYQEETKQMIIEMVSKL